MATPDQAQPPLRIFFFPSPTPSHMSSLINMAKLFARRGDVVSTIVTTPGNERFVRPAIADMTDMSLLLLPFPSESLPLLPGGHENFSLIPSSQDHLLFAALSSLQSPLEDLLRTHRPDCLVSDGVYTWSADVALALGIPRLIFPAVGIFPAHVIDTLSPLANADAEIISSRDLFPHRIDIPKAELSSFLNPALAELHVEAERKSVGYVFNTFRALEGEYAEICPKRAWCVGPVALANRDDAKHECLDWLDSAEASSVVYACFGSLNEFRPDELRGIALALESSGYRFVWAVRDDMDADASQWLPEGFEARTAGRGVIIRGWAPQVAILSRRAVGAFVTHCGWNSALEGVVAGLPMVTWPLKHDQFVNERFITEVLRVGVSARRGAALTDAVREVMGGGGEEMRLRARALGDKARAAVEEGGSSYCDIANLIGEIRKYHHDDAK